MAATLPILQAVKPFRELEIKISGLCAHLVQAGQFSIEVPLKDGQRPTNVRRNVLIHDHTRIPYPPPLLQFRGAKQRCADVLPPICTLVYT